MAAIDRYIRTYRRLDSEGTELIREFRQNGGDLTQQMTQKMNDWVKQYESLNNELFKDEQRSVNSIRKRGTKIGEIAVSPNYQNVRRLSDELFQSAQELNQIRELMIDVMNLANKVLQVRRGR